MLLVSIHDVTPRHLERVKRIRGALTELGIGHVTLLAVPEFHGQESLAGCTATTHWLRRQIDSGDEVALHGHYHRQLGTLPSLRARARARLFTAGEGECLALRPESTQAMMQGKQQLENLVGCPVRGFVAPAWLEPTGFRETLRAQNFLWHEVSWFIERLGVRPQYDARAWSPVIGFATRTRMRLWSALAWARVSQPLFEKVMLENHPIRVALHPSDWDEPLVIKSARRLIQKLVVTRTPRRCADLCLGDRC